MALSIFSVLFFLVIFLIIGAGAGWLVGQIMDACRFGGVGDIVVGIIGAQIGGWLFVQLFIKAAG